MILLDQANIKLSATPQREIASSASPINSPAKDEHVERL